MVEECTAEANTPRGGAVAAFAATLTLANASLARNRVVVVQPPSGAFDPPQCFQPFGSGAGGAVFLYEGQVLITQGSELAGNEANVGGGAYVGGGGGGSGGTRVSVVGGSTLASNAATATSGGALHLDNVLSLSLEGAELRDNYAAEDGGAVFLLNVPETELDGVQASGNRAGLRGGVLFATAGASRCRVTLGRSGFTNNSAVAGAVAFLVNDTAAGGPCGTAWGEGSSAVNNTATSWGPRFATNISRAEVVLGSAQIASGANILVAFSLFDGFGEPINGLPGATITATSNLSTALAGTTSAFFNSAGQTFPGMKLIGSRAAYALDFTVVPSTFAAALLPEAMTARAVVTISGCSLTEFFDPGSQTCVCITNSQRNNDGVCTCSEGTHITANGTHRAYPHFISLLVLSEEIRDSTSQCVSDSHSSRTLPSVAVLCTVCQSQLGQFCRNGLLAPLPGFWHSFPNSGDVQPCPNVVACASGGDNRTCARARILLVASPA